MSKTGIYSMSRAVSEHETQVSIYETKERTSSEWHRRILDAITDTITDGREYAIRVFPPEVIALDCDGIAIWRLRVGISLINIRDALVGDCVHGGALTVREHESVVRLRESGAVFSLEKFLIHGESIRLWRRIE